MADLAARDEMSDERLDALAVEYATTIDMTWVPDLAARHGYRCGFRRRAQRLRFCGGDI